MLMLGLRILTRRPVNAFSHAQQHRKIASMAGLLRKPVKIALVQMGCGADKPANLKHARSKVLEAAKKGAQIVVLPECFNSPYGTNFFPTYAETLPLVPSSTKTPESEIENKSPSESYDALAAMAKDANVFLVGGSIPEREIKGEDEKLFNTSIVFDTQGKEIGRHRKVHLFDIDIPGGITFKESEVLSAGNKVSIVDFEGIGKIGLAICYDVRFPELAMIAARKGCFALVYPGAFNTTTGPLHWRLLGQARAVDNQCYVAMCSPARDDSASYKAWGHSLVADPMGKVLDEAGEGEEIIYAELSGEEIEKTRKGIPVYSQRRFEVYPDVSEGKVRYEEDS